MNGILKATVAVFLRIFVYLLLVNIFVRLNPEALEVNLQNLITVIFVILSYLIVIRIFIKNYPVIEDRQMSYPIFLAVVVVLYAVAYSNGLLFNVTRDMVTPKLYSGSFYLLRESKETFYVAMLAVAPFFEELLYRKIVIDNISEGYNKWVAILVSSFLFSIAQLNMVLAMQNFILGLLLAFVYVETKSIKETILIHALFNLFMLEAIPYIDFKNFYLSLASYILFALCLYNYTKLVRSKIMKENG